MINALLIDSCILHTRTFDTNNEPTDVDVPLSCKAEYKTQWIKDINGEDFLSQANVMIKNRTVTHDYQITFDGKRCPVKKIAKPKFWSYNFIQVFL